MDENRIATQAVDAAYQVHTGLGPGLFESVYELALAHELTARNLRFTRQTEIPVHYRGVMLEAGFRADLVIENLVVVEVKSVESLGAIHKKQLLTYLRLMNLRLGLLINFNVPLIRDGISRVVNGLPDT